MQGLTEFFPLLCGSLIGLLVGQFRSLSTRRWAWAGLSCVGGVLANFVSFEGYEWLPFDLLLVALTAQAVLLARNWVTRPRVQ